MDRKFLLVIIVVLIIFGGSTVIYFKYLSKKVQDQNNISGKTECDYKQECNSTDPITCFKESLVKSGCFSDSYIDENFKNIKISSSSTWYHEIIFDYALDGKELCHSNCNAKILILTPENMQGYPESTFTGMRNGIVEYEGPLYEGYTISKQDAQKIFDKSAKCKGGSDTSLILNVRDSVGQSESMYNKKGLYWVTSVGIRCGRMCSVNAATGELNSGNWTCE